MQNNDYLFPSIAALSVAMIFPIYWVNQVSLGVASLEPSLMENFITLGFLDVMFLAIGLLSIYVYLKLRKIFNDQLNFKNVDVLLMLLIGAHVLHIATLGLDLTAASLSMQGVHENRELFIGAGLTIVFGGTILFGLFDLLIGAVLLKHANELPTLIKIFALITLIQGVLGISIVFSPVTLVSFSLSLIILSIYFLSKPESVEVV